MKQLFIFCFVFLLSAWLHSEVVHAQDFSGSKLPERVELLSEKSSLPVCSILTKNVKLMKNILKINVKELPRGTYYLHFFEDSGRTEKAQKIRVVLK